MSFLHTLSVVGSLVGVASAVNNGLARTPQMGWNNWNSLGCDVSESLLLETSLKIVDSGLRDVGYNYIVLDDCWSSGRGSDGYLMEDLEKFPRGMKQVASEIHDLNLLFGMYSSAGEMTCARYAGSLDWETQDAQSFASWDVDYLKYDNCYHLGRFGTPDISFRRFEVMWKAINATGRPMLYSLCNWGEDYSHTWGMSIANSWRMSGDIYDSFTRPDALCSCDNPSDPHCIAPGSRCSILNIINKVAAYSDRAQPGGWNDLDMLEVGNGGMDDEEYKAHFSMWAALKSPLLMGNDLRTITGSALTILNNPAVIAVNQDPLGRSANRVALDTNVPKDKYGMGETQVWSGHLSHGDQLVVFFNAANEAIDMSISLEEVFVSDGPGGSADQVHEEWEIYDLWANRMDNVLAQKLLDASPTEFSSLFNGANWYNSTDIPYKVGLKNADPRLMGKKIGKVEADGTIKARVKRHSVEMYRLRSTNKNLKRYASQQAKDEL